MTLQFLNQQTPDVWRVGCCIV